MSYQKQPVVRRATSQLWLYFQCARLSLVSLLDIACEMFTFKLYLAPNAVTLAFCAQESTRKRDDEALESEKCMSVRDEVIATMKRLWPNGFVWRTALHDMQKLEAGLVAFRALEDYHARRLQ